MFEFVGYRLIMLDSSNLLKQSKKNSAAYIKDDHNWFLSLVPSLWNVDELLQNNIKN